MVGVVIAVVFTGIGVAQTGPQLDPQNQQIRDRYLVSLQQNPVQDQAFARVYESYLEFEGIDAWIAKLKLESEAAETKSAALILLGRVYQRQFKTQDALRVLEQAASLGAPTPELQVLLGSLYADANQFERAVELLGAASNGLSDATKRAQVCRTLGGVYLRLGKRDEAIASWRKLVELAPKDPFAYEELAAIYEDNLLWPEAIGVWKSLLEQLEGNPYLQCRAWRSIGQDHERAAGYADAIAAYERALTLAAPGNWLFEDVKERLVGVYDLMGDLDGLQRYLEAQIAAAPANLDFPDLLAETLTRRGQLPEAEAVLQRMLERAPDHFPTYERLIALYARMEAPDKQRALFEKLILLSPAEPDYLRRLGESYLLAGDPEAAKTTWRRILSADAKPEDHALLASWFEQYEFPDDAIPEYEAALATRREREWVYRLADLKYTAGDSEEAVTLWKSVLTPESTSSDYAEVGSVLVTNKLEIEASKLFEKAIELDPKAYEHRATLARLYMNRKAYPEALAQFAALEQQTDNAYHKSLGERGMIDVYAATGELEARQKEWEEEVANNPDKAAPKLRLARLYERLGNQQRMVELYEQCTQVEPNTPAHWQTLANAYTKTRQVDKAIEANKKLVDIDPARVGQYYRDLIRLYTQANRKEEAIAAAERVAELAPDDVDVRIALAQTYFLYQRPDDGLQQMRYAIRFKADDPRLHAQYGDALASLQRLGEAQDAYRKMLELSPADADRIEAVGRLAAVYQQQQRAPELVQEFKDRVRQAPKDLSAYQELAAIYRATGDLSRSIDLYETASNEVEDKGAVLRLLLNAAYDAGKLDKVVSVSEQIMALSGKPTMSEWERLGTAYAQLGNYEKAKESWDRITADNPTDANAYKLLARTLANWGQVDESFAVRRKAIELDPTDYALRIEQARTLTQFDKLDEALKDLLDLLEASQLASEESANTNTTGTVSPSTMSPPPPPMMGFHGSVRRGQFGSSLRSSQAGPYGSLAYYRSEILSLLVDTASRTENLDPIIERLKKRMSEMPGNFRVKQDALDMYVQIGKSEEAIALAQSILEQQPNNNDLRWQIAGLFANLRQFDAAEHEYRTLMDRDPQRKSQLELQLLGLYRQQEDKAKAFEYAESLLKERPQDAQTTMVLAQMCAESGDMARSKELFTHAAELNPQAAQDVRMQMARAYAQRGELDAARSTYEEIVFAPVPAQQQAQMRGRARASVYIPQPHQGSRRSSGIPQGYASSQDYRRVEAIQQLTQMSLKPEDMQAFRDKLKGEAEKWFAAASPEARQASRGVAQLYLSQLAQAGNDEEGRAFVARMRQIEPADSDLNSLLLYFMEGCGDWDGMMALYGELEANDSSLSPQVQQARLNIALLRDDLETAVTLFRERMAKSSSQSQGWNDGYILVEKLRNSKRMDLLIPILEEQATALRPGQANIAWLVQAYLDTGETEKALALARRAWEDSQRNPLLQGGFGRGSMRGMPGQDDPAFMSLLNAYQRAQRISELVTEFEDRLKKQPTSLKLRECLIALYQNTNRVNDAVTMFKELSELRPNSAQEKMELAQFLVNNQRAGEAIPIYEGLLRTQPSLYFSVSWQIRQAYQQAGRKQDLATLENQLVDRTNNLDRLQELAQQMASDKSYDRAAELYERILRTDPKRVYVRTMLADVYRQGGKKDEAMRVYRDYLSDTNRASGMQINFRVAGQIVDLYAQSNRLAELKDEASKALQANPSNRTQKGLLAAVAKYEKRHDDAMKLLEEIHTAQPNTEVVQEMVSVAEAQQDYVRAIELMETKLLPQGSMDWNRLAELYLRKGDRKAAYETFKRQVSSRNDLYAMNEVLQNLVRSEMWEEAEAFAREAFEKAKGDENVVRQLGYTLSEAASKSDRIAAYFEKEILIQDSRGSEELLRQYVYRIDANPNRVRNLLQPLLEAHPDNFGLIQLYVERLSEQMTEEELVSIFGRLTGTTPDQWYTVSQCGRRLVQLGRGDAIVEPLQAAMIKNPDYSLIRDSVSLLTQSYTPPVINVFSLRDTVLDKVPEIRRAHAKAGFAEAIAHAGDVVWARDAFREAYEAGPKEQFIGPHSRFLYEWGYWEDLAALYKSQPPDPRISGDSNMFDNLLALGEIDALEDLATRMLLERNGGNLSPYGLRTYLGINALIERLEAKAAASGSTRPLLDLANACQQIELNQRSTQIMKRVLEIDPGNAQATSHLQYQPRDPQKDKEVLPLLEKQYSEAVQSGKSTDGLWEPLARAYIQADRKDDARKILDTAQVPENNPWLWISRARIYIEVGDMEKAYADILKVQDQARQTGWTANITPVLIACGKVDEGLELWRKEPRGHNVEEIADALSKAGKHAEALEVLRYAVEQQPNYTHLQRRLAAELLKTGNDIEAWRVELSKALAGAMGNDRRDDILRQYADSISQDDLWLQVASSPHVADDVALRTVLLCTLAQLVHSDKPEPLETVKRLSSSYPASTPDELLAYVQVYQSLSDTPSMIDCYRKIADSPEASKGQRIAALQSLVTLHAPDAPAALLRRLELGDISIPFEVSSLQFFAEKAEPAQREALIAQLQRMGFAESRIATVQAYVDYYAGNRESAIAAITALINDKRFSPHFGNEFAKILDREGLRSERKRLYELTASGGFGRDERVKALDALALLYAEDGEIDRAIDALARQTSYQRTIAAEAWRSICQKATPDVVRAAIVHWIQQSPGNDRVSDFMALCADVARQHGQTVDMAGLAAELGVAGREADEAQFADRLIETWLLSSAVPMPSNKEAITASLPDSVKAALAPGAPLPSDGMTWKPLGRDQGAGIVWIDKALGMDRENSSDKAVLAIADVTCPTDATITLTLGSDDSSIVWVNGQEVFKYLEGRFLTLDQNRFTVPLHAGVNRIVVGVGNNGGNWGFCLGMLDAPEGTTVALPQ